MTFGLLYAFTENFVLPLSHDEVVHGKGSLLGKMPGDRWQRFANLRAYFGFMWAHPGKKLLFMGGEFAQEREWNHDHSLDWHLLDDPMHRGVQSLVRDLNRLYREVPALHALDADPAGFEWIDADRRRQQRLRLPAQGRARRPARAGRLQLHAGGPRGLPHRRAARRAAGCERLNTDAALYGGSNVGNSGMVCCGTGAVAGAFGLALADLAAARHDHLPALRIGACPHPWPNMRVEPACPIRSGRPGTAEA